MTTAEVLSHLSRLGVRLFSKGEAVVANPRNRLTDEARELIRQHKADLLAALRNSGTECLSCARLEMRFEHYEGNRRKWWWRCDKGYELLEGRHYGERLLIAPAACDAAGAFEPWKPGEP